MAGLTNYTGANLLNWITGKSNGFSTLPQAFVGLFLDPTAGSSVGSDANSGFTEVSGNAYARVSTTGATWNSASGTSPSSTSNASTITFPTASGGNWGTVIAFGIFDAATAGNLLAWDYLGNFAWLPFTCTSVGSGNGSVLNAVTSGYSNSDVVIVNTTYEYGGSAPGFTQSNFTGDLVVANVSGDTFTVTNNGTAVWTNSTGSGLVRKITKQTINSGVQASFSAGTLTLTSA